MRTLFKTPSEKKIVNLLHLLVTAICVCLNDVSSISVLTFNSQSSVKLKGLV